MSFTRSFILILIVLHAAAAATCVIPDLAQALNKPATRDAHKDSGQSAEGGGGKVGVVPSRIVVNLDAQRTPETEG
jgi:hypothetical protein